MAGLVGGGGVEDGVVHLGGLVAEIGGFEPTIQHGVVYLHFVMYTLLIPILHLLLLINIYLMITRWPRLRRLVRNINFLLEHSIGQPCLRARFLQQQWFVELGSQLGLVLALGHECAMREGLLI